MKTLYSSDRLIKDQALIDMLEGLGVPIGVLVNKHPKDIENNFSMLDRTEHSKTISSHKQKKWFNKALNDPLYKNYFLLCASLNNSMLVNQLGLRLFCAFCSKTNTQRYPIWFNIDGSNKLSTPSDTPSAIFISGIAVDSSLFRIEKTRDLLAKYSHIPRIVLIAGGNPVEFAKARLYVKPDQVIWME
jgi:hypothetical protein